MSIYAFTSRCGSHINSNDKREQLIARLRQKDTIDTLDSGAHRSASSTSQGANQSRYSTAAWVDTTFSPKGSKPLSPDNSSEEYLVEDDHDEPEPEAETLS